MNLPSRHSLAIILLMCVLAALPPLLITYAQPPLDRRRQHIDDMDHRLEAHAERITRLEDKIGSLEQYASELREAKVRDRLIAVEGKVSLILWVMSSTMGVGILLLWMTWKTLVLGKSTHGLVSLRMHELASEVGEVLTTVADKLGPVASPQPEKDRRKEE